MALSTKQQEEKDALKERLLSEHNLTHHHKADALFDVAWEIGHSSGFVEVGIYFDKFSVLLDTNDTAINTLKTIAALGGNLPDSRFEGATGPNDAAQRGMMFVGCRQRAIAALKSLDVKLPSIVEMIPQE